MLSPRLKGLTQTGSLGTKSWVVWGTQWWKRGGYRETENAGDGCGIMREFLEKCSLGTQEVHAMSIQDVYM